MVFTPVSNRIKSLDYLKAICIIGVVTLHVKVPKFIAHQLLFPFWAQLAVPFFMVIAGYVLTISWQSKHDYRGMKDLLKQYFLSGYFETKFWYYFIPFLIVFAAELIYFHRPINFYTIEGIGDRFLSGGFFGPGSYFIPVFFKFLVFFPFIYFLMKKGLPGFILILILHVAFEIWVVKSGMPTSAYRLTFCKYLGFVAIGIGLALYRVRLIYVILSMAFGAAYICASQYFLIRFPIFRKWSLTALPTAFWVGGIIYLMLRAKVIEKINLPFLSLIGRATYHIFLVQMLFYTCIKNQFSNIFYNIAFNVPLCLGVGLIFYVLHTKTFRWFIKK